MIIELFHAKVKLGQGTRAAKTQAIKNLYKTDVKTNMSLRGWLNVQTSYINYSENLNN